MLPTRGAVRQLDDFLALLVRLRGTALYFAAGQPPQVRFRGGLWPLARGPLSRGALLGLLREVIRPAQWEVLERDGQTECGYVLAPDGVSFRICVTCDGDTLQASAYRASSSPAVPNDELSPP